MAHSLSRIQVIKVFDNQEVTKGVHVISNVISMDDYRSTGELSFDIETTGMIDIDYVLSNGGSFKFPRQRKLIAKKFQGSDVFPATVIMAKEIRICLQPRQAGTITMWMGMQ